MAKFTHVELWSGPACANGVRLGPLITGEVELHESVAADDRLQVEVLPRTAATAQLAGGRCLRLAHDDPAVFDEFTISRIERPSGEDAGYVRVVSLPVVVAALAGAGKVKTYGSGGVVSLSGSIRGTFTDIVTVMLDYLALKGIDWITLGDIDFTDVLDFEYFKLTPLAFLQSLLSHPAVNGEWTWERDGLTGYLIHAAPQINADASVPVIRSAYNLRSHLDAADVTDQANAIFPTGASVDGKPTTIGEITGTIAAIDGDEVEFEEDIVPLPDMWNGAHLVKDDANYDDEEILDSIPPNRVQLGSVTGFSAGHVVGFRETAGSDGKEITVVKSPGSILSHGYLEQELESGVIALRSHVRNPDFALWTGADTDPPDGWSKSFSLAGGSCNVEKTTDAAHRRNGVNSVKLTGTAQFIGLKRTFYVHRRVGKSKLRVIALCEFDSGAGADSGGSVLRAEVLGPTGAPLGGSDEFAYLTPGDITDGWYLLPVPIVDAIEHSLNSFTVRITYGGDPHSGGGTPPSSVHTVWIDSVWAVLAESDEVPFLLNGANDLLSLALQRLEQLHLPVKQHTVSLLDLGGQRAADVIVKGGNLRIINSTLGTDDTVRVMAYDRSKVHAGKASVTLASRRPTMTRQIVGAA